MTDHPQPLQEALADAIDEQDLDLTESYDMAGEIIEFLGKQGWVFIPPGVDFTITHRHSG